MSDDWDSATVIGAKARGNAARTTVAKTNAELNAARRSGTVVATEKKYAGGSNKVQSTEGQRLTKIDRENEVAPPPKVDLSVGKAMAQARQAKEPSMSQKDLATKVNEKPSVINDYESGRAVPNQVLLGKLERALGVKLRGKDIGSPIGGPKKK